MAASTPWWMERSTHTRERSEREQAGEKGIGFVWTKPMIAEISGEIYRHCASLPTGFEMLQDVKGSWICHGTASRYAMIWEQQKEGRGSPDDDKGRHSPCNEIIIRIVDTLWTGTVTLLYVVLLHNYILWQDQWRPFTSSGLPYPSTSCNSQSIMVSPNCSYLSTAGADPWPAPLHSEILSLKALVKIIINCVPYFSRSVLSRDVINVVLSDNQTSAKVFSRD